MKSFDVDEIQAVHEAIEIAEGVVASRDIIYPDLSQNLVGSIVESLMAARDAKLMRMAKRGNGFPLL